VGSSSPPGQLTGLLEKDPSAVPVVMWTEESLAVHPDNRALIPERSLPPPEDERGGESEILAENEQLIEPGAGPEKWRGLGTAEAGVTVANTPAAAASSAAASEAQARRVEITFVGAAGRSLTNGPLPRAQDRPWSWPKPAVIPVPQMVLAAQSSHKQIATDVPGEGIRPIR